MTGTVRDAADLRGLLRQVLGPEAELQPAAFRPGVGPRRAAAAGEQRPPAAGQARGLAGARRSRSTACWRSRRTGRSCCSRPASSMPGSTSGAPRSPLSSASSTIEGTSGDPGAAAARVEPCCRNCGAGLTECRPAMRICAESGQWRPSTRRRRHCGGTRIMKLNVAIQMDHVSTIDIDGDSTFVLGAGGRAARLRGLALHAARPDLPRPQGDGARPADEAAAREGQPLHPGRGRDRSISRRSTSCCCARIRRSTCPTSRPRICWSTSIPRPWWSTIRPACATRRRSCSSRISTTSCRRP